jgi:actin cytoskeleton-regulatory complex protein PAN1
MSYKCLTVKCRAQYPYEAGKPDELSFAEGEGIVVVEQSEGDWWMAEKGGVVYLVPAAYMEVDG